MENQHNGYASQAKIGRFQASTWKRTKTTPAHPSVPDYFPERTQTVERACIRYSKWNRNTRKWERNTIWCDIEELRDLFYVLEELNEKRLEQVLTSRAQRING